jgi:RHS repeat-associated protein
MTPLKFRRALSSSRFYRQNIARKLVCLAIVAALLILPGPSSFVFSAGKFVTLADCSAMASTAITVAVATGPWQDLVRLVSRVLGKSTKAPRQETLTDRINRITNISVSPRKWVGYVGDNVTFVAIGSDGVGEVVQGAKFDWESSNSEQLTIDDAGRAELLRPGRCRVTCRAGSTQQSVIIHVRPTRRPMQTDSQWKADQDSLDPATTGAIGLSDIPGRLIDNLAPTAHAQGNSPGDYGNAAYVGAVGTPPFAGLEDTRLGPVMPRSNFELSIPLVNLGGRGLAANLNLYYNSNTWGAYFDGQSQVHYVFDPIQGWPGPGMSLGFGRIVYYNASIDGNGNPTHSYMLIDPDGTRHDLGVGTDFGSNTLKTIDGSHATFVGNAANGGTLYYNDGTAVTIGKVNNRLLPTQITDTNGNYIQIAYRWETNFPGIAINYIVDTLGRVIQFNYGQWPAPDPTSLSSITSPLGTVTFGYQTVTMNYNFVNAPIIDSAPATFYGVTGVSTTGGPQYGFTYSGYGMIYSASITSAGGTATVTYNYPTGGEEIIGGPVFTQRTESPSSVYSYATDGTITRPDGSKLTVSNTLRELKNSSGASLSKSVTTFTTDPGGSTAVQSVVNYNDIGQQTKIDYTYDQYGNVVDKREYGFQVSGQWQVRRRTHTLFLAAQQYLDAYIRNLPSEIDVYDALLNTNDADDVVIGKTQYCYDNYLAMGGMENYGGTAAPPGHLSSYDTTKTTRGNTTCVTTYSNISAGTSVTHNQKIDIFGGVTKAEVDCCHQKSFTMTQNTYWTKPEQVTKGDTSGIYLTSSNAYNFNTLTESTGTDPDGQIASYSYDAQMRPTGFTTPTGATGTTLYNVFGQPTSSSVTYSDGGTNKTTSQTAVYDGWGQKTQSVDVNGAQINFTYDSMGRLATQTNPFPHGGTPGPVTSFTYDLLGRVTVTTLPGGNTIQMTYSGTVVTTTDQVNRKIKRETDGLGRLIKVTEQDVSTGSLTQETTYTYDAADRLTGVNQGGQTRSFKYDDRSRLLYERIPEMTATINDGTGTLWTSKYTYNSFDAVATRQDARGVISTYGYDTLNRLTSITYNTVSGVVTAPSVTFNYDTNQTSNTKGLLLSLSVGTGYSETYNYNVGIGNGGNSGNKINLTSLTRTIDGRNYTTSYQYNAANQITQMTYPSARVMNLSRDSKGRLSSVGPFLTSVTYNGIGQVTGDTLGNGVTETFGYDANRLQLTSQTAGTVAPYTNRMNLTYSYAASTGQMGSGSTAGNAGQLMTVSGTINGTTESAAYTYDNLGRLVTSNQTSNGSSAQRRFAYDRWGNRTAVWDATSAGNQIQSIALMQSGGIPTNQIQSVTTTGTINYTYDAAGNVTNDGTHTYTYDSANRVVSVDAGSTAQYGYDYQNRRYKKTVGSTITHYVWQGSQVLAEHNGSTGGVLVDYVVVGSRMIATGDGQYFLKDRLSTRLTMDSNGNVIGRQGHLPFGEDFAESGTQEKHHFTTYERDSESRADYALNRYDSASLGRFLSIDTAGSKPGAPQTWNRYTYTSGDPMNHLDPSGLDPIDPMDFYGSGGPHINVPSCGSPIDFGGIVFGVDLGIIGLLPMLPCEDPQPRSGEVGGGDPIVYCEIIIRFSKLSSDTGLPARHAYILTRESNSGGHPPNFFRGGPDRFFLDPLARLFAQGGFYTEGTRDFQPGPIDGSGTNYDSYPIYANGPCQKYEDSFIDTMNRINSAGISYTVLDNNSNAVAYTMLLRAGLPTLSASLIRSIIGDDSLDGWGIDLSQYFK